MACALVPASSYVWVPGNRLPAHACKLNNRGLADCAPTNLAARTGDLSRRMGPSGGGHTSQSDSSIWLK